jgi:hypothetical protein
MIPPITTIVASNGPSARLKLTRASSLPRPACESQSGRRFPFGASV